MAAEQVFDYYFQLADQDRDGRINGGEAVAFFQRSGLPQHMLAKIWQVADRTSCGFLSRAEFHAALRLVTIAQSGRPLTQDVAQVVMAGQANQVPPPQIAGVPPLPAAGPSGPPSGSFSAPVPSQQWQQQPAAPQQQSTHPPAQQPPARPPAQQPAPAAGFGGGSFATSGPPSWQSGGSAGGGGPAPAPSAEAPPARAPGKASAAASIGSTASSHDGFGGDPFSSLAPPAPTTSPPQKPKQGPAAGAGPGGAAAPLQAGFGEGAPFSSDAMALAPYQKPAEPAAAPVGGGSGAPWPRMTAADAQRYTQVFASVDADRDGKISGDQARELFLSWKIPREVLKRIWDLSDQDQDSMLSLREFCTALYLMERHREGRPLPPVLPTGIQFDDPNPPADPRAQIAAQQLAAAQAAMAQGTAASWAMAARGGPGGPAAGLGAPAGMGATPGVGPAGPGMGPGPSMGMVPGMMAGPGGMAVPAPGYGMAPTPGSIPLPQGAAPPPAADPNAFVSKAPTLEFSLLNQLKGEDKDLLGKKQGEAADMEKKAWQMESELMDAKQKADFYRNKMQELILFESRCKNRLAEIGSRVESDKKEAESLAKRYDDKYKTVAGISGRLAQEEAYFREIEAKRAELFAAVANLEAGGDPSFHVQDKVDRISADLDALHVALVDRALQVGAKAPASQVAAAGLHPAEAAFGWQDPTVGPAGGLVGPIAEWDANWDKFDDEGFVVVEGLAAPEASPPPLAAAAATAAVGGKPTGALPADMFSGSDADTSKGPGLGSAGGSAANLATSSNHSGGAPNMGSPPRGTLPDLAETQSPSTGGDGKGTLSGKAGRSKSGRVSKRYAGVAESGDFNASADNAGPPSFSSATSSFEEGPGSFSTGGGAGASTATSGVLGAGTSGGGPVWAPQFQGADDEDDDRASWGGNSSMQRSVDFTGLGSSGLPSPASAGLGGSDPFGSDTPFGASSFAAPAHGPTNGATSGSGAVRGSSSTGFGGSGLGGASKASGLARPGSGGGFGELFGGEKGSVTQSGGFGDEDGFSAFGGGSGKAAGGRGGGGSSSGGGSFKDSSADDFGGFGTGLTKSLGGDMSPPRQLPPFKPAGFGNITGGQS